MYGVHNFGIGIAGKSYYSRSTNWRINISHPTSWEFEGFTTDHRNCCSYAGVGFHISKHTRGEFNHGQRAVFGDGGQLAALLGKLRPAPQITRTAPSGAGTVTAICAPGVTGMPFL